MPHTDNSPIKKHSVVLDGRKTSISLERAFFDEIKRMAAESGQYIGELIIAIDEKRNGFGSLSGALRLAVLADLKSRIPPQQIAAE